MNTTNKKWFDATCRDAQTNFKAARNRFNPDRNDSSRIQFTRARTYYNRAKNKAQQRFRISEGQWINNLAKSEPRRFWKNIKKSYKKTNAEADKLDVKDLHDHFQSIFGEQYADHTNVEPDLNQNVYNEELDSEFTDSELRMAVFTQKNNKSPGIDNIPCEIIKAAYGFISPFLLKLYNRIYSTGEYPRSWGDGIITPIFKQELRGGRYRTCIW